MTDSPYDKMLKKFLIPLLRKKSLYWPGRTQALGLARIERGFYICANCKNKFGRKNVHVDHIKSVIDTSTGWDSWDTYIKRLYVPAEQLQVLCVQCHKSKSLLESQLRKIYKRKNK